ncbi:MAG TPA: putative transporter small subunit [Burkholderiaceae bacterium]|nr:putative transporter small subunit [Burkholderiaceae bacterium]
MKFLLTFYILIWPVISAGVLALLVVSLVRDIRRARRKGESMV